MLIRRGTAIALVFILALTQALVLIAPARAAPGGPTSLSEEDGELDAIVVATLAFYAEAFPEIAFVALPSGDTWLTSFATFLALLGDGAQNLDYEHPAHPRSRRVVP